ncbi:MAG: hypothetical protein WC815_10335 [Vicinamibacterales bacterium]|jgi:hypothetical protein
MPPLSSSIEEQVQQLTRRLEEFESRLAAIEQAAPRAGVFATAVESPPPAATATAFDPLGALTYLGRSLIILGGAFLLRALTEAGTWPPVVGVSMGLLYALTWLVASGRAAAGGRRLLATFDGGTAVAIGFPLIMEAALKFGLFTPTMTAAALGVFTACVLLSANYGRLQSLAWLASLGGLATGLTLMARTGAVAPLSFYFTSLGVGTLWLGYLREWRGLRWPTGAVACFAVLGVTLRAVAQPPVDPATTAWAIQGFLLVAYLGSIAIRTLVRGRQVIVFEMAQTVLVLVVGLGGMIAVGHGADDGDRLLGGVIIGLGAAAYAVSFQFLARHAPGALNFYFYSSLALIFVMVGTWTALHGPARALALTGIGVALAVAWSRSSRATLGAHTAIALVAAAGDAGLLTLGLAVFMGELPSASLSLWPALVAFGAVLALSGSRLTACRGALSAADAPGLTLGLVAVVGLAGLVTLAAVAAAAAVSLPVSADMLTTMRTAVLSMVAVGCARLARTGRFSAIGWLAYPLLAATGLKLVAIDLRSSQASTLFAALAFYGAALVLVPRLRKLTE